MEYICNDCPRKCVAFRSDNTKGGVCNSPALPVIARAAPHFGEEPCISGTKGSGAIFFTGCSLKCVFCQNHEISRGVGGESVSVERLRDIMTELRDLGVHNINLVTPSHFARAIEKALSGLNLGIPVVWNSSGYESVETLKRMEGLVQIYMPDFKYADCTLAGRYSKAPDYPQAVKEALSEMFRQVGKYRLDDDGILKSGLIIRHLILPEAELNSMDVIDYIEKNFPEDSVLFSLMSQYTPMPGLNAYPELLNKVDKRTCDFLYRYMINSSIHSGYWQENDSATDEMIPEFDGTGVLKS